MNTSINNKEKDLDVSNNKDAQGVPKITQFNPFDLQRKSQGQKLSVKEATRILGNLGVEKVKEIMLNDGYLSKDINTGVQVEYIRLNLDKLIPKRTRSNIFEKYKPVKEDELITSNGAKLTVQIQEKSYQNAFGVDMLKLPLIASRNWQSKQSNFNNKIKDKYKQSIDQLGSQGIGYLKHDVVCTNEQFKFVQEFYGSCKVKQGSIGDFKIAFCGYDINANFKQNDYYDVIILLKHLQSKYQKGQSINYFKKMLAKDTINYIESNKEMFQLIQQLRTKDSDGGEQFILPAFISAFLPSNLLELLDQYYGYAILFNNLVTQFKLIKWIDANIQEIFDFIINTDWANYKIDKFGVPKEISLIWFIAQCVWLMYGILLLPMPAEENDQLAWAEMLMQKMPEHITYSLTKLGCSLVHSIIHNEYQNRIQYFAAPSQIVTIMDELHVRMQKVREQIKGGGMKYNKIWKDLAKTPTFAYRPITWDATQFSQGSFVSNIIGEDKDNLVARYPSLFKQFKTDDAKEQHVDIEVKHKTKNNAETKKQRRIQQQDRKETDKQPTAIGQTNTSKSHPQNDVLQLQGVNLRDMWIDGEKMGWKVIGGDQEYFKKHFGSLRWSLAPEYIDGFNEFYWQTKQEKPKSRFRDIFFWYYRVPLTQNLPQLVSIFMNEKGQWFNVPWIKDFQRHLLQHLKDHAKEIQSEHRAKLQKMEAELKPGKNMALITKAVKQGKKNPKSTKMLPTFKQVISELNKLDEYAGVDDDEVVKPLRSKSLEKFRKHTEELSPQLEQTKKVVKDVLGILQKQGYMSAAENSQIKPEMQDVFIEDSASETEDQETISDSVDSEDQVDIIKPDDFFQDLKTKRQKILDKAANKEVLTDAEQDVLKQTKELMQNPWYEKFQNLTKEELDERRQQSMADKFGQGLDQRNYYNDVASGLAGGKQLKIDKRKFNEVYLKLSQRVVPLEDLINLQTPFPDVTQFYNKLVKSLQLESFWVKMGKGQAFKIISDKFLGKIKSLGTTFIWGSPQKYFEAKINENQSKINELKKIPPDKRTQKQKSQLKELMKKQITVPDVFTAVTMKNSNFATYDDQLADYVEFFVDIPSSFKYKQGDAMPSYVSIRVGARGKGPNVEAVDEKFAVNPIIQYDPGITVLNRYILANWYSFVNPTFYYKDMEEFKQSDLFIKVKDAIDSLTSESEVQKAWRNFNKQYFLQNDHIQAKNHMSRAIYIPRNRMNESGFVVNGRTLTIYLFGVDIIRYSMGEQFLDMTRIADQIANSYATAQTARVSAGTPQGQIARLMDCYYQHFVMKQYQGDKGMKYYSISQNVAPLYIRDFTQFDKIGLLWNKFSVPADMSTGPMFRDAKRDYVTFLNELIVGKQFLQGMKNGFKFNKEKMFVSYMKPKEELVPVSKFLKKWRNVFGGNTCIQLPLQLLLNADKGQFFHKFYQPNNQEPIWIILGMDQQISLKKIIHQAFPRANEFKGDQWFIYSDNVYLYNTETKLLAAIDGSKMESQVNKDVLKAVFKDILDGLKARVEKKIFKLNDKEAVLAAQCWFASKVTFQDYLQYKSKMQSMGKQAVSIQQFIDDKMDEDGVSHIGDASVGTQFYRYVPDKYKYLTLNAYSEYIDHTNAFEFFSMLPVSYEEEDDLPPNVFCCKWKLIRNQERHDRARKEANIIRINKLLEKQHVGSSNEVLKQLLANSQFQNLIASSEEEEEEELEVDLDTKYTFLKLVYKARFNEDYNEVEEEPIIEGDQIEIIENIPQSDQLCEEYVQYFSDYVDHSTAIFGTNIIPIPFLPSGTQFTVQANTVISYNFAVDVYRNKKMKMPDVIKALSGTEDLDGVALSKKQISKYSIMKLEGVAKLDLDELYSGKLDVIETQFLGINVVSYPLPHMELRSSSLDPGMLFYGDKNKEGQHAHQVTSQLLSYMFQGAVWDLGRMVVILYNFAKGQTINQMSVAQMCNELECEDMLYADNVTFLPSFFRETMRRTLIDENDEDSKLFQQHYKNLVLISLALGAITTKEMNYRQLATYCQDILDSTMSTRAKLDIFKKLTDDQIDELVKRYPSVADGILNLMVGV